MKPDRMEILIDNIPQELTDMNQWVVWRWELRDGKWTKPPYNPNSGELAKSTDPGTWADFNEAFEALQDGEEWDGLGLMLTPPHCGIDWDNSVIPETGDLHSRILSDLRKINSYSEISPSGKGVKTLCRATLPKGGHHTNGIGIFQKDRYFCITGHVLPGVSKRIEDRQKEIDSFCQNHWPEDFKQEEKPQLPPQPSFIEDSELIEKIKGSAQAQKFNTLWSGDFSGFPSQSEADLALCSILAFWCGNDPSQIDRIFRQSGLYRQGRWDGHGYGARTINKAISTNREAYKPTGKEKREKDLGEKLRLWIEGGYGTFHIEQIYKEFEITRSEDKNIIRVNLNREVKKGTIERGVSMGLYQKVDQETKRVDILGAVPTPLPMRWPGELEKIANVYPQSIVCNVGSPNSGKTAFNLNAAYLNRDLMEVVYFLSEMGEQVIVRPQKFDQSYSIQEWNKIDFRQRTHDFHQVIRANALNIIDYLEVIEGKFYMIGDYIRRIYEKLDKGIALVSLQMNPGAELAWGGPKTLDKACLYFTLDQHRLKIVKGKARVNDTRNPDKLSRSFALVQGCKFQWGEWENYR